MNRVPCERSRKTAQLHNRGRLESAGRVDGQPPHRSGPRSTRAIWRNLANGLDRQLAVTPCLFGPSRRSQKARAIHPNDALDGGRRYTVLRARHNIVGRFHYQFFMVHVA